jgi:MFS family permease
MVATLPGRTQGLGLITEPLLSDLQLDRVAYASMNLWATLLGALLCFPAGWAIDRFGLRWVTATVTLLLGITVSQFGAMPAHGVVIFVLLLCTRAFGQSALSVCSIATVARWFPNRAGFAMGVYSVLLSVLFAVAFGAVGYSVRVYGWRSAWGQVALALIFLVVPMIVLLLRAPAATVTASSAEPSSSSARQLTLGQALRTSLFWVFAGAAAAFNLVSSGLGLFTEAVLRERGFDQKTFHVFLIVSTLMSLAGQFGCGWLTRRWRYQSITFQLLFSFVIPPPCSLAVFPLKVTLERMGLLLL